MKTTVTMLQDQFDSELNYQITNNLFNEDNLRIFSYGYSIMDLSEYDVSEIINYINNKIEEYKCSMMRSDENVVSTNKESVDSTNEVSNKYFSSVLSLYHNNVYLYNNNFKFINNILFTDRSFGDIENVCLSSDNDEVNSKLIDYIKSTHPTINFASSSNLIYIPITIERILDKYMSINELLKINKDINVSKEQCFMFLNKFAGISFYGENKNAWRYISKYNAAYEIFGNSNKTSRTKLNKLISILETGTKKYGSIIEIQKDFDFTHYQSRKADGYRLSEEYRFKGFKRYELKTETMRTFKYRTYLKALSINAENSIVRDLLMFYSMIQLPTKEEVTIKAKELVKLGKGKKGKKYKFRNSKGKEYDDVSKFIYMEDSIRCFEYFSDCWNQVVPSIGTDSSGGRVYDNLNMMPSWIRKLIKVNGKYIVEVDYHCLHPNIAMSLYGGSRKYLTHEQVGLESGLDESIVKTEHLSFFNKNRWSMENSLLFDYYNKTEHTMIRNLFDDKKKYKYTITSKRMFTKEVEIMTDCIQQLNKLGIYVLYIFDALGCAGKDKETVRKIMNDTIIKHNVFTTTD